MSAMKSIEDCQWYSLGDSRSIRAVAMDKLFFAIATDGFKSLDPYRFFGVAFASNCPESLIPSYIGKHPEALIEGFTASAKPSECQWMANSRIKSVENQLGSVLVELEPERGKHEEEIQHR